MKWGMRQPHLFALEPFWEAHLSLSTSGFKGDPAGEAEVLPVPANQEQTCQATLVLKQQVQDQAVGEQDQSICRSSRNAL